MLYTEDSSMHYVYANQVTNKVISVQLSFAMNYIYP